MPPAALAHFDPSPVKGLLIFIVLVVAYFVASLRPARCRSCGRTWCRTCGGPR